MKFSTTNPATGKKLKSWSTLGEAQVLKALNYCELAFKNWRQLKPFQRAEHLRAISKVLEKRKAKLAEAITLEMGKPLVQSVAEVEKCAWLCRVYADNAEKWLQPEEVEVDGVEHKVVFEPLGVVLSVMPWNFPLWQAFRFAVPAITAGNTTLLRHSSVVPECAALIEETFLEAGVPEGVLKAVVTDHKAVERLIAHPSIAAVSLTGSTGAGARVAGLAGKNLKPFVLELGGSDAFIVLEDADLEVACAKGVYARTQSNGQSCIAAKRFIVVESRAVEFLQKFTQLMKSQVIGNPLNEGTQVGPLATKAQLKALERQVALAKRQGAKVLCGGKRANVKGLAGYFYEPTVAVVSLQNVLAREEVFGPVAAVIIAKDEDEAVKMANASDYGLGASVWTKDLERGKRVAQRLEAGCTFVNSIVKSDPRMPFGGIKKSGVGRELSHYGLKEFVNVKTVNVYEAKK